MLQFLSKSLNKLQKNIFLYKFKNLLLWYIFFFKKKNFTWSVPRNVVYCELSETTPFAAFYLVFFLHLEPRAKLLDSWARMTSLLLIILRKFWRGRILIKKPFVYSVIY